MLPMLPRKQTVLRFRLTKSYKSFRQPAFIENKKHLAQLSSTNFASNIKQIQAIELISFA